VNTYFGLAPIGLICCVSIANAGGDAITPIDLAHLSRFATITAHALDSELRDFPHSRLRNVRGGVYPFGKTTQHGYLICGEVNSRNVFGGYSGWRRFVSSGGTPAQYGKPTLIFDDNLDDLFVRQLCQENADHAMWTPLGLR
jgi:hypothetical protein